MWNIVVMETTEKKVIKVDRDNFIKWTISYLFIVFVNIFLAQRVKVSAREQSENEWKEKGISHAKY